MNSTDKGAATTTNHSVAKFSVHRGEERSQNLREGARNENNNRKSQIRYRVIRYLRPSRFFQLNLEEGARSENKTKKNQNRYRVIRHLRPTRFPLLASFLSVLKRRIEADSARWKINLAHKHSRSRPHTHSARPPLFPLDRPRPP